MAQIVWGFPGIGKSTASNGVYILDVDYNKFQFKEVTANEHSTGKGFFVPDEKFPQNYVSYLKDLPPDVMALTNGHISYLKEFKDCLLIYPDASLKDEYLLRYKKRGDHESFISYMDEAFDSIIKALDQSPYRKIKVTNKDVYLNNVLNRRRYQCMFMTKKDLMDLLMKAKELGESDVYKEIHCNILDSYCLGEIKDVEDYCMKLFEGEVTLDAEALRTDIRRAEAGISIELAAKEKRGGLSREELADKIMDGIINGALGIEHGQIAPYSYGYEVTYSPTAQPGRVSPFINRWECYCDFFDIGRTIVGRIENGLQSDMVFGDDCKELDIRAVLSHIDKMEKEKASCFVLEEHTDFKRATNSYTYPYRSDVATVMDVHKGKGLDGIVLHHYHGDYSTITTSKQNQLVEMLVCLKGFCLDAINTLDCSDGKKDKIISYLKKKGIDITTTEKLKEWIDKNPDKCAFPHNRKRAKDVDVLLKSAKEEKDQKLANKGKELGVDKSFRDER